jgi:hypothetical protein
MGIEAAEPPAGERLAFHRLRFLLADDMAGIDTELDDLVSLRISETTFRVAAGTSFGVKGITAITEPDTYVSLSNVSLIVDGANDDYTEITVMENARLGTLLVNGLTIAEGPDISGNYFNVSGLEFSASQSRIEGVFANLVDPDTRYRQVIIVSQYVPDGATFRSAFERNEVLASAPTVLGIAVAMENPDVIEGRMEALGNRMILESDAAFNSPTAIELLGEAYAADNYIDLANPESTQYGLVHTGDALVAVNNVVLVDGYDPRGIYSYSGRGHILHNSVRVSSGADDQPICYLIGGGGVRYLVDNVCDVTGEATSSYGMAWGANIPEVFVHSGHFQGPEGFSLALGAADLETFEGCAWEGCGQVTATSFGETQVFTEAADFPLGLLSEGPCVDSGVDPAGVAGGFPVDADIQGEDRPADGVFDIGADEYWP